MTRYAVFDTAIGRCGIAWGERGLVSVQLPERSEAATRARLARSVGGAAEGVPPPDVRRTIERIVALFRGEPDGLGDVVLDDAGVAEFDRRVYAAARAIPPGETRTYGELAAALGEPGAARAVGRALARNPFPVVVPCHRVVAAGGRLGGFSAAEGVPTKVRMLALEGARVGRTPSLFDEALREGEL